MNFEEKERILKSVMNQIEPERTARKKAQIKKLSSVAAIVAVVLLLGACAVKVFHLDEKIAAVIGGSDPAIERVAADIDAVDENNGIRIEGKQVVSDGKKTYISFDVISLTDLTFKYDNVFEENLVLIGDYPMWGHIYSISAVSDDGKTMSLVLELETNAIDGNYTVTMILDNLLENWQTENVLVEGRWEITFDYEFQNLIKTFDIDDEISIDGIVLSVDKMEVSPLTCHIEVSVTEDSQMPPEEWWGIDTISSVVLLMSNGDTVIVSDRSAGWTIDDDGQRGNIRGEPAHFINVDDIVGISFDDQVVDLK